jgi:hypothetical protein
VGRAVNDFAQEVFMPGVLRRLVIAVALCGLLAGCPSGTADCDALPDRYELALDAETLTPSDPAVCRGDEVTLLVRSEADGIFHIHAYDEQVPATPVTAGESVELNFTADRSGQFSIELHPQESRQGVVVGILTVHEP